MIIQPVIQGVIAKSAHPHGCEAAVQQQIDYVRSAKQITNGAKRVLILGASSGFGLAARIAATFGGSEADTIGVSFERGPSEKGTGSAGWYNNIYFKKQAEAEGRIAINIVGDAFSRRVREQVVEAIETYFEGEVDLIIYSLATGVRPKRNGEGMWRSAIKTIGESASGATIMLEDDSWQETIVEPATEEEIESTIKVMGGGDWEEWIDTLINSDSIAPGCKTIAFSYIGPQATYPIYHEGTLGRAKVDLHQTSHALNMKMANFGGGAYATVCKALVTKASVFIPAFTPYILALYKVMKKHGTHEDCIGQMQRLFADKLYQPFVPVDGQRLLRMDEFELDEKIQREVAELMQHMDKDNFHAVADYQGYKNEFLKLNGFGFEQIDYDQPVDMDELIKLTP
ncbi:enoyl-ACP reductase FabV [Vibrio sp. SCSIO 43137]|uniref:enoyl-ACP reductase FabV n=1 Tax=Vibrio sp. SCSIO 43137 TaxID=3021011 RepID=UPI002307D082|nr:enoyl-ACP reductase FabV [Vibrio sp. SCSIO 43137]WCE32623.1 trans-2-enoyl-CoA reductase family protein [Vibrio sp. SCSIO 43137]